MPAKREPSESERQAAEEKVEQLKTIPGGEDLLKGLYLAGMIPGARSIQKVERGQFTEERRAITPNYPTCPECGKPWPTSGRLHKHDCPGYIVVPGAPKWMNNKIKKDQQDAGNTPEDDAL